MSARGDSTGPPQSEETALVGGSGSNTETGLEKQQSKVTAAAPSVSLPPLPLRYPPYPKSGKRKAVLERDKECRRISKLAAKDPRWKLPTVIKPKDPGTADCVASLRDKALVREAGRSIVKISFARDGNEDDIWHCTGIVVGWKETKKCARILGCSLTKSGLDKKPKLHVHLPNNTVMEGQLLFFSKHYDIFLLEISSESDLPLQLPSFGSNPNYDQEAFVLARGKESNLMARRGRILWIDGLDCFSPKHRMFLSCPPPPGLGGVAIDLDGNVVGMAFAVMEPSILAISTIITCIEMWLKFSCIARPAHGLGLRTMEFLDVSLQEMISHDHKIHNGYIIDAVEAYSTAERLGIRYGDVIVSFDGLHSHTLPQLEDYLLSLGWKFLEQNIDSRSTIDLKLEVYDLLGRITRNISLPVEVIDLE